jgi:hypothetical protein
MITKKKYTAAVLFICSLLLFSLSCKKEKDEPMLIVKYTFSPTQERLGNFGEPQDIPEGNAAQTPNFHLIGIGSLELIATVNELPTLNSLLYVGPLTNEGGEEAFDFDQQLRVSNGEIMFRIPLKDITPGTYTYLRNSVEFQSYDINFIYTDATLGELSFTGRLASFVGFKQFIRSYKIKDETVTVNANKTQGYFGFEYTVPVLGTQVLEGQAPGTTVPNSLPSSPIPLGSCLVTGPFVNPLTITGNETEDIVLNVSISINNSFEWTEIVEDGKYEPSIGETVVDMGLRGLKVFIE